MQEVCSIDSDRILTAFGYKSLQCGAAEVQFLIGIPSYKMSPVQAKLLMLALFTWIALLSLAVALPAKSYTDIARVINPNQYVSGGKFIPGQAYWPGGR